MLCFLGSWQKQHQLVADNMLPGTQVQQFETECRLLPGTQLQQCETECRLLC
jgi:hypothetical protein